jgi:predicted nucleotidyltransferase
MDKENLWKLLNERRVDYVVIGAAAFPTHGYARATLDLDLFIRASPENARQTLDALTAFGYDTRDLSLQDLLTKKVLIREYSLETDVHPFVKGVTFDHVWGNRVSGAINGVPVSFPSLDDLIQMKKAAGRPKDQEDIKALLKIKQMQTPGTERD